ncbi:hypothetical protein ACFW35_18330 [Fictibacillus sp. NPDC058756]|uniref:hypothetical protein n=1 Tax=Fictibacillus sp. NPDC058756 TaxID=3346625 RepID=UPI0036CB439F
MKIITNLLKKAESVEGRYIEALNKKEEMLLGLHVELAEKEVMLKDLRKMKVLGDISEEHFAVEEAEVEAIRKKVLDAQKEVQLIQEYKTEDVKAVIEELEADKQKLIQTKQKELRAIQTELAEAKKQYFQALIEASDKYNKLVKPERKLDTLKVQLGLQKQVYTADASESLSLIHTASGGSIPLTVAPNEVYDALVYNRIDSTLKRHLEGK